MMKLLPKRQLRSDDLAFGTRPGVARRGSAGCCAQRAFCPAGTQLRRASIAETPAQSSGGKPRKSLGWLYLETLRVNGTGEAVGDSLHGQCTERRAGRTGDRQWRRV